MFPGVMSDYIDATKMYSPNPPSPCAGNPSQLNPVTFTNIVGCATTKMDCR